MFFPIVLSFILRQGDRDPCIFSGTALYLYCSVMKVNHLLHNYIVDDEDVQKKLDLPVLGFIPEV